MNIQVISSQQSDADDKLGSRKKNSSSSRVGSVASTVRSKCVSLFRIACWTLLTVAICGYMNVLLTFEIQKMSLETEKLSTSLASRGADLERLETNLKELREFADKGIAQVREMPEAISALKTDVHGMKTNFDQVKTNFDEIRKLAQAEHVKVQDLVTKASQDVSRVEGNVQLLDTRYGELKVMIGALSHQLEQLDADVRKIREGQSAKASAPPVEPTQNAPPTKNPHVGNSDQDSKIKQDPAEAILAAANNAANAPEGDGSYLNAVKREFVSSWNAYKQFAWGHDELRPNTQSYVDWGGKSSKGLALTIIDSLDTLLLMNLTQQYNEAIEFVLNDVQFDQDIRVSTFETTIRIVAGLLSAYELTGESDKRILSLATKMMDHVLVAFNTSTGIPHQTIDLKTRQHWSPQWSGGAAMLSEFGSLQLELRTLSYHTKDPVYDMKGTHIMSIIEAKCPADYLCPTMLTIDSGEFRGDHITVGAMGDSFYEYLLKQYLLTGKTEQKYAKMSGTALDAIIQRLLRYSEPSRLAFVAEYEQGALDYRMDHLACFAGGMFALASESLPDRGTAKTYMNVAEGLTKTCYHLYASQPTGLAAEINEFPGGADPVPQAPYYQLRPETAESIFYLWRLTGNPKYKEWQWNIFTSIRRHCRVASDGGYAGIRNVGVVPPEQDNQMQSFWTAETLKYIYLTFADSAVADLRKWVFTTEGHLFRIRQRDPMKIWTDWEAAHGSMPWVPPTVAGVTDVETDGMKRARAERGDLPVNAPVDPLAIEEPPNIDDVVAAGRGEEAPFEANIQQQNPHDEDIRAEESRLARILGLQPARRRHRVEAADTQPEGVSKVPEEDHNAEPQL